LFDETQFGISIVWGVYSVPCFESEWFWHYWKDPKTIRQNVVDFMKDNYPPPLTYPEFASGFTA
jgi:alpha-L-fucosidase